MWGGLSFDMYNVFRNVMHELHLAVALDSGKVQEAGTLSGLSRQNMALKMPQLSLLISYRVTM